MYLIFQPKNFGLAERLGTCYNVDMDEATDTIISIYSRLSDSGWLGFFIYLLLGFIAVGLLRRIVSTLQQHEKLPAQVLRLIEKALAVVIWCLILVQALRSIGVDVVSILGAAGVVGVAIGFAAQTSLSNLISGIFIISERNIRLGDFVNIAGMEGTVESINLLSISLRQADNSLVRIPCETAIKSPVVNITGDTLRRCDLDIGVDYSSDLEQVRSIILSVIAAEPGLIDTPQPVVQFKSFADSAIVLHIGAWCKTDSYHAVRYRFADNLLKAFRANGINIPFPTVSIRK